MPADAQLPFTPMTAPDSAPEPGLRRALGRWDLAGLAINGTIGAGILGLPGPLFAALGSWSLLAVAAGGALVCLVAAAFAQAGSRFARTGGATTYVTAAFGPMAGFAIGWLQAVTGLFSYASVANLLLTYAAALLPGLDSGFARLAALAIVTCGLGSLVYTGVRVSAVAAAALTWLKFTLLLGFTALALPALWRHGLPRTPLPAPGQFVPGLTAMIFAAGGMEAMVVSGGEMRRPARDLPQALGIAMGIVIAIYAGVLLACIGSVPDLAHVARPVYDGARLLGGPAAGAAIAAGGAISMAGVLFTILFADPRVVFALASAGHLPAALTRIHPRFHTPHRSIALVALLGFTLAATSSFAGALMLTAVTRLLAYAGTALAAIALAWRGQSETPSPLAFRGGQAISAAAATLCLALLSQNPPHALLAAAAALIPGLTLAMARHRAGRRRAAKAG